MLTRAGSYSKARRLHDGGNAQDDKDRGRRHPYKPQGDDLDRGLAQEHRRHVGDEHAQRGADRYRDNGVIVGGEPHDRHLSLVADLHQEKGDQRGDKQSKRLHLLF